MAPKLQQQGSPSTESSSSSSSGPSALSSASSPASAPAPLVRLVARSTGPKCPFGNERVEFTVQEGGCVALCGSSGRGKTTLANVLAGITPNPTNNHTLQNRLNISIDKLEWNPTLLESERCGVLFQQTTLLDELTVAGNLKVALEQQQKQYSKRGDNKHSGTSSSSSSTSNANDQRQLQLEMKQLLDAVGLDYDRDASKRVTELSGGMSRRASLALQLAQHKHLIVLDEPFAGLDYDAAVSVAKELVQLRLSKRRTAFLLISHEPHLTKLVMDSTRTSHLQNDIVELLPPTKSITEYYKHHHHHNQPSLFGTTFYDRFVERLGDYVVYSLPLICLAFVACGLAISMLSADLLQRLEISNQVLDLVDKEVRPLIKMLTGEDANAFQMMGIRFKVNSMLNQTVPPAKATLFAIGLCKLFVLEVGPLLTALLLCGRIGGSYAGRVATLESSQQNKLLQVLGISPRVWTLYPSLLAAIIAGPVLTVVGTCLALVLGGWVGPKYGIGNRQQYHTDVIDSLFPRLRIQWLECLWMDDHKQQPQVASEEDETTLDLMDNDNNVFITYLLRKWAALYQSFQSNGFDWTVSYDRSSPPSILLLRWKETLIELVTYPPIYHLVKSTVFIVIILGVAECIARSQPQLTPRGVPSVITFSVVTAGLLVILADWGFSQLWLLRH
jgi:ABC-type multidrug transport system ATPase subunit/ABC-type transporter Mla maintaining outer membrane lipid asymmetry permease subunit MlaE